jgi:hypothetical protein
MFSELNAEERRVIWSTFKQNSISKEDLAILELLTIESEIESNNERCFDSEEIEEEIIYCLEKWGNPDAGGIADAS